MKKIIGWMHDQPGRVDIIHDSVKQLWIKAGQPEGFFREKVPCKVEHYTIPLYFDDENNNNFPQS